MSVSSGMTEPPFSEHFDLVGVWRISVELGPEDDDAIRNALNQAVGLNYGGYDQVSFETANGTQHFRGRPGTVSGEMDISTSRRVRVLKFSVPHDRQVLETVLGLISSLHSYEEPVVHISETLATRSKSQPDGHNPRKWWSAS